MSEEEVPHVEARLEAKPLNVPEYNRATADTQDDKEQAIADNVMGEVEEDEEEDTEETEEDATEKEDTEE